MERAEQGALLSDRGQGTAIAGKNTDLLRPITAEGNRPDLIDRGDAEEGTERAARIRDHGQRFTRAPVDRLRTGEADGEGHDSSIIDSWVADIAEAEELAVKLGDRGDRSTTAAVDADRAKAR